MGEQKAPLAEPDTGQYPHVVRLLRETPWAILPATLEAIVEVVRLRASGQRFSDEEIEQRVGARRLSARETAQIHGTVAVLPLYGVIAQRMNLMTRMSGGTSTEQFSAALRAALDNPEVGAVVLDIDSPGGSVFGVEEAADIIFSARGKGKPIVAVANSLAASAAYWLGSQADEFVVTPSGEAGSIGVLAVHQDLTAMAEKEGVKITYVSAGRFKTEGAPFEPLTDEARVYLQERVDAYYRAFVGAVARGREASPKEVRGGFGEGRVVGAAQAVKLGMADRVETLGETLARLSKRGPAAVAQPPAAAHTADPVTGGLPVGAEATTGAAAPAPDAGGKPYPTTQPRPASPPPSGPPPAPAPVAKSASTEDEDLRRRRARLAAAEAGPSPLPPPAPASPLGPRPERPRPPAPATPAGLPPGWVPR